MTTALWIKTTSIGTLGLQASLTFATENPEASQTSVAENPELTYLSAEVGEWLITNPNILYLLVFIGLPIFLWSVVHRDDRRLDKSAFEADNNIWGGFIVKGQQARLRASGGIMRLIARTLDIVSLLSLLFLLQPRLVTRQFRDPVTMLELFMGIVLVWIFIEALQLTLFQTTLGKYILKIRIAKKSGERIRFSEALKRSFHIWWRGLGTGFPLLALITLPVALTRLVFKGELAWDRDGEFTVTHEASKNPNPTTAPSNIRGRWATVKWILLRSFALTAFVMAAIGIGAIIVFQLLPTGSSVKFLLVILIGAIAGMYGVNRIKAQWRRAGEDNLGSSD